MNILIINQENHIRDNLTEIFKRTEKCDYMAVTNIDDALKAIENGVFDLIISDPTMLDIGDEQISALIKEKMESKPILFYSDTGSFQTALEYIGTSDNKFYIGAFPVEKIEDRIESFIMSQATSDMEIPIF